MRVTYVPEQRCIRTLFPLCAIGWRDYLLVRVCLLMCLLCRTYHLSWRQSVCVLHCWLCHEDVLGVSFEGKRVQIHLGALRPLLTRCCRLWIFIYGIFTLMVVRSWWRQMSLPFFTSQASLLPTHRWSAQTLRWEGLHRIPCRILNRIPGI